MGPLFLLHLWMFTWFISPSSPKTLFPLSWSLSVPISRSQADPDTLEHLHFTTVKLIFLIKRGFWCKGALLGDLGPSWARFWRPWARMCCSFGAFKASRWQLRLPRIPPNVDKSNSMNQTWIFKESAFPQRKIAVFEGEGGNPDFQNVLGEATVHRILRWIMAFRSRASAQSFYTTYVYIIVSILSHSLLPDRCFPVFWSLSLSILTSQADPLTLRNRTRLSIRLRIIIPALPSKFP